MENPEKNISYQIGSTTFNVERVFMGKKKIKDLFKQYLATKLNEKNITDFTNSKSCDIIING